MEKRSCLLVLLVDVRHLSSEQMQLTRAVLKEHVNLLDAIFRKGIQASLIPCIVSIGVSPEVVFKPKPNPNIVSLHEAVDSLRESKEELSPNQVSTALELVLGVVRNVNCSQNALKKILFLSSDTSFGGAPNISQFFRKFSQIGVQISFASVMGDCGSFSSFERNRGAEIDQFTNLAALFQDHFNCSITRVQDNIGALRRFFNQELSQIFNELERTSLVQIEFGGPFSSNAQTPLFCDVLFESLPMLLPGARENASNFLQSSTRKSEIIAPKTLKILKRIDLWSISEELLFGIPTILVVSKQDLIEEGNNSSRFSALYSICKRQDSGLLASSSQCFETGIETPSIRYLYLLTASENDCSFMMKKIIGQEQYLLRPPAPVLEENNEIFREVEQSLYGLGEKIEYCPLDWAIGIHEEANRRKSTQNFAPAPTRTRTRTFNAREHAQTKGGKSGGNGEVQRAPLNQPSKPPHPPASKKRKFQRIQQLVTLGKS